MVTSFTERQPAMKPVFNVVIEKNEDGYFVATVPALRGCHTQAKSLDVLMKRVREAIELCLEVEDSIVEENMTEKTKKAIPTRQQILDVLTLNDQALKNQGVRRIGLFGSFARNEGRSRSDLDFLVELEKPTFDNFINLAFLLEKLFVRKVDLVTPDGLNKHVRPYVEKEVIWHEA